MLRYRLHPLPWRPPPGGSVIWEPLCRLKLMIPAREPCTNLRWLPLVVWYLIRAPSAWMGSHTCCPGGSKRSVHVLGTITIANTTSDPHGFHDHGLLPYAHGLGCCGGTCLCSASLVLACKRNSVKIESARFAQELRLDPRFLPI